MRGMFAMNGIALKGGKSGIGGWKGHMNKMNFFFYLGSCCRIGKYNIEQDVITL